MLLLMPLLGQYSITSCKGDDSTLQLSSWTGDSPPEAFEYRTQELTRLDEGEELFFAFESFPAFDLLESVDVAQNTCKQFITIDGSLSVCTALKEMTEGPALVRPRIRIQIFLQKNSRGFL